MPYKTALTFTYDCGEFEGNMQKAVGDGRARRLRGAPHGGRVRAASCAASGCATASRSPAGRSCVRRRIRQRCAWPRTARCCCDPVRCRWGRGWRRHSASLSPIASACRSTMCATRQATPTLLSGGKGNGGSGALCIGGSAVSLAVDKVIDKARQVAAELLEAAVVDVTFDAGRFTIAGTDRSVSLAEVAHAAIDRRERTGGKRRIHPHRGDLPERHAYLRGGDRSRHRRDRGGALQRGGGTRLRAEPDAGGGADAWRCRAGRRPGDGRADRARSAIGPDADRVVHGLPDAARR